MSYRLLLDENVEHDVLHRLESHGHDVEHVDLVPNLSKGDADRELGTYSLREDRLIVTYDNDFVLDLSNESFRAALYFDDQSLSSKKVADIVHSMAQHYPQKQVQGVEYAGSEWL